MASTSGSAIGAAADYAVPIWIDGAALPADKTSTFPITNSVSGKTLHHAQNVDKETAQKACDAAKTAFKSWRRSTVTTRRDILNKVADNFQQRQGDFVRFQVEETNCDETWATNNVERTVLYLREIAACLSTAVVGDIPSLDVPNAMGFIFKEPVGPVLTIPPWNAALILSTRAMATAIAAGCTVVLKASELCPRTHHAIVEAFTSAGLPSGVLNQVQCTRDRAAEITEAMIAHEAIRKVEFIGSAAVGRIIGATAAKYLKPVLMELGGKCPAIVLDDADLQRAAMMCAKGATTHHGQICFSTERVIVHEKVAEQFQGMLVKAFEAQANGASAAVTEGIAKHAEEVLKDSEQKGNKILTGGADYTKPLTLKPTLVFSPSKDSRILDEETFGPSASMYIISSDQEAIDLANASSYGLNATIHTRNMERGLKMARELEYGQVHMNMISLYVDARGSQGGVKGSGWGRQNASYGLSEFLVEKFISWHSLGEGGGQR